MLTGMLSVLPNEPIIIISVLSIILIHLITLNQHQHPLIMFRVPLPQMVQITLHGIQFLWIQIQVVYEEMYFHKVPNY